MSFTIEQTAVKAASLQLRLAETNLEIRQTEQQVTNTTDTTERMRVQLELITLQESRDDLTTQIQSLSADTLLNDQVRTPTKTNDRQELDEFLLPISPHSPTHRHVPQHDHTPPDNDNDTHRTSCSTAYTIKIATPQPYKTDDDICLFFERFSQYVKLANLQEANLNLYLLSLFKDDKMYRKLCNVPLTNQQKCDATLLIAAYENALFPATETRILRSSLSTIQQKLGEKIPDFIVRIDALAAKAFQNIELREEVSLSALISGLRDTDIKKKLLEADITSYDDATRLCTKHERISETIAAKDTQDVDSELSILKVTSDNQSGNKEDTKHAQTRNLQTQNTQQNRKVTFANHSSTNTCFSCGLRGHKSSECHLSTPPQSTQRDMSSVKCYNCNRMGHFARTCTQARHYGPNTAPYRGTQGQQRHRTTAAPTRNNNLNSNTAWPALHPSRIQHNTGR